MKICICRRGHGSRMRSWPSLQCQCPFFRTPALRQPHHNSSRGLSEPVVEVRRQARAPPGQVRYEKLSTARGPYPKPRKRVMRPRAGSIDRDRHGEASLSSLGARRGGQFSLRGLKDGRRSRDSERWKASCIERKGRPSTKNMHPHFSTTG
jgi:hypothetical protein